MVERQAFGAYSLYCIQGETLQVTVTDLGAAAVSIRFRGREMILGYDSPEGYLAGDAYIGAAVGRYANRIGGAAFPLEGRTVRLVPNEGANQLHGGPRSWDKRPWEAEIREDAVRFTLRSPDGDGGFPGAMTASVTYTVRGDTLRLDFEGDTDRTTVYAPTSHMYFTLGGRGSVLDAQLQVNADRIVEVGEGLIPTGRLPAAAGRFDFRSLRPVAEDYDDAFVLTGETACVMRRDGIGMAIRTDFPALQVYTGAFLSAPFQKNQGLALEPEFFPDSPNHPDFPSTLLRPGEHFRRWMEFGFTEE